MDKLQSGDNLDQVGMHLCGYGHDTFQQDDDPAVSLPCTCMNTPITPLSLPPWMRTRAPFSKVELIRIVVGDIFFVLG